MTWLLDASVLIPVADSQHIGHQACRSWLLNNASGGFATCAITELAVLRYVMCFYRELGIDHALDVLDSVRAHPGRSYLVGGPEPRAMRWMGVLGHSQVTDAYLAGLARANDVRLATLDRGLAAVHADVAELVIA